MKNLFVIVTLFCFTAVFPAKALDSTEININEYGDVWVKEKIHTENINSFCKDYSVKKFGAIGQNIIKRLSFINVLFNGEKATFKVEKAFFKNTLCVGKPERAEGKTPNIIEISYSIEKAVFYDRKFSVFKFYLETDTSIMPSIMPDSIDAENIKTEKKADKILISTDAKTKEKPFVILKWSLEKIPYHKRTFDDFLDDNTGAVFAFAGIIMLIIYVMLARWLLTRMDFSENRLSPFPPKGISPAVCRYLMEEYADIKTIYTIIAGMGAKGKIGLYENDEDIEIELKDRNSLIGFLEETELATVLFSEKNKLSINDVDIRAFVEKAGNILSKSFNIQVFCYLGRYWLPMVLIIFATLLSLSFCEFQTAFSPLALYLIIVQMLLSFLFLRTLIKSGFIRKRIKYEIENYTLYLKGKNGSFSHMRGNSKNTQMLFDKHFPFAVALDMEDEWTDRFRNVLFGQGMTAEGFYVPDWYHGQRYCGGKKEFSLALEFSLYIEKRLER